MGLWCPTGVTRGPTRFKGWFTTPFTGGREWSSGKHMSPGVLTGIRPQKPRDTESGSGKKRSPTPTRLPKPTRPPLLGSLISLPFRTRVDHPHDYPGMKSGRQTSGSTDFSDTKTLNSPRLVPGTLV